MLEAGGVLPHERTTAKASTDRLDLTRATAANLSPVWGLSLSKGLTELLAEPGEPLGTVTEEGIEHVVERVTDPHRIAAITDKLAADDVLIADGHHRYGVSRIYRDEIRDATGRTDTPAELTWPSSTSSSRNSSALRRFIVSTAISKSLILLVRWPDRSTSFPPNGRARQPLLICTSKVS